MRPAGGGVPSKDGEKAFIAPHGVLLGDGNGVQPSASPAPPFDAPAPRGAVGSTKHALRIGLRTGPVHRRSGASIGGAGSGLRLTGPAVFWISQNGGHRFRTAASAPADVGAYLAPRFTRIKVVLKARRC